MRIYTVDVGRQFPTICYEAAGRDGRAMEVGTTMAAVRRGDSAASQSHVELGSRPGCRRHQRSSSKQQALVINCLLNLKLSPSPLTLFFSPSLSIHLVSLYIYRELTTLALGFNC